MSDFDYLVETREDQIATLTIDREEKLNALNSALIEELRLAIQNISDDKDVKAAIITGKGNKAFVAGADIGEIAELNELNGRKFAESGQEVFHLIENCPKPIIAAVNGYALGGGCELAMACHMRLAVESAKFGQPEVNLGIIPGYGGTQRLSQLIGKTKALEFLLTGQTFSAREALQLGLVNYVTESNNDLMEKCHDILHKIAAKAPRAIEMIINAVNAFYNPQQNGFQTEANGFANCCSTTDFKEGTSAFLEKRTPRFSGK